MERRLAAILAADVVGYSRLMGDDEVGTLAALNAHREELIEPKAAQYHGRTVKLMGDGALMEFGSVVDAVTFAVEVQIAMRQRNSGVTEGQQIVFRIGINLGDIILQDEDIYGDGVNVAARLEGLAEPGGICLSRAARDQVRDKLDLRLADLGEVEVKNISRPVRAFQIILDDKATALFTPVVRQSVKTERRQRPLAIAAVMALLLAVGGAVWWQPWTREAEWASVERPSDLPAIAVLPFENMSGDPAQDYFSDGITEDLITDLSQVSGLFVIARNSSFTYKGAPVKVQQVGRELGVQYVLKGSVRKAGNRVRINAQLVDAQTGRHLWADRYDRELTDVFTVQDEVTREIVSVLAVKLSVEDEAQLRRSVRVDPDAYDMLLRGLALQRRYTQETIAESRDYFDKAIAIDPGYGRAHANMGYTLVIDVFEGWAEDREATLRKAEGFIEDAVRLDPALPQVHFAQSSLYRIRRQLEESIAAIRKATELDPNYAEGYAALAITLVYAGRTEQALEAIQLAMRLNPFNSFYYYWVLGQCYFHLERYEEAAAQFERVIEANPQFIRGHLLLAAAYAQQGRLDDAEWETQEALTLQPEATLSQRRGIIPYKIQSDIDRYIDGLRKAGLPE